MNSKNTESGSLNLITINSEISCSGFIIITLPGHISANGRNKSLKTEEMLTGRSGKLSKPNALINNLNMDPDYLQGNINLGKQEVMLG
ncbi:MAG: hypothetical protein ACQEP5_03300 [Actinomycetota bacterium]